MLSGRGCSYSSLITTDLGAGSANVRGWSLTVGSAVADETLTDIGLGIICNKQHISQPSKNDRVEMLLTSAFWKQSNWKVPVRMSSTNTEAACFTLIFTAAAWKCCQAVVCTAQLPTAIEAPIKPILKQRLPHGVGAAGGVRRKAGQRKLWLKS